MAQINLGRIGFVNKGNYLKNTDYKINDVVTVGQKFVYTCTTAHTSGESIDESKWSKWIEVEDGVSVTSILQTGGDGSPGTSDTYTIGFSDGGSTTFDVYNGKDMTNADVVDDAAPSDSKTYSSTKIDNDIRTVDMASKARSVAMAIALA